MVTVVSILMFSGAFAAAIGVMVVTVAPQWQRILRLASGQIEPGFSPLAQLASAERRIAVRRWATPTPVAIRRPRAVA